MKNFKPGQQVVFKTEFVPYLEINDVGNYPKENEIVTIRGAGLTEGWWILEEYPVSKRDIPQQMHEIVLFPLEDIHQYENSKIEKDCQRAWKLGEETLKKIQTTPANCPNEKNF